METSDENLKAQSLADNLDHAAHQLLEAIAPFSDTVLNRVPFEGSWTAAQVSEHVLKSLEGINQMVNAPTRATTRDPEQYIKDLRAMMENFEVKAKSAANLLPGNEPMAKTAVEKRLLQDRDALLCSVRDLDLLETCICAEFPGIGYLTRFELISFAVFHTRRHIQQIKNIFRAQEMAAL